MRIVIIGLLTVLALIMVAAVVAYSTWGVWGLAGLFAIIVVGVFTLKSLAGRVMTSLFLTPFKMKGKVLMGARVDVHDVTPADPPNMQDDYEEDLLDDEDFDTPEDAEEYRRELQEERREAAKAHARRQWFLIDVTITPQDRPGDGFKHWEPGDLTIVEPSSDPVASYESGDDDEVGEIAEVMIWDDEEEAFREDEQCKYFGPQRLRLHAGVDPGHPHFAFRYYFEQFGELQLSAK